MKIFIDTNVYLDFYRSNNNAIEVFDKLLQNVDSIVITEQVIDEFYRSRISVLNNIKNTFEKESKIESLHSSYLGSLVEFKELVNQKKEYEKKRNTILKKIEANINNIDSDPIHKHFDKLIKSERITLCKTNDNILKNAQYRKLKGNPPISQGNSIGDEINWETILEYINEDLVIVSRDQTFANLSYLRKNFKDKTKHKFTLTKTISEALELIGKRIPIKLTNIELQQLSELSKSMIKAHEEFKNNLLHNILFKDIDQMKKAYSDVLNSNNSFLGKILNTTNQFNTFNNNLSNENQE